MRGLRKIGTLGAVKGPRTSIPDTPIGTTVQGRPPRNPAQQTLFPRGIAMLQLGKDRPVVASGPGEPPELFVTDPHVSTTEWVLYWASGKLFNDPKDVRQPPYTGGRLGTWEYQVPDQPGQVRQVASGVSDFVYHLGTGDVIVRLDTFYYHLAGADPAQLARDVAVRVRAHRDGFGGTTVRTIYDTQLLGDPTGAAAVAALADVLAGREVVSPVRSGLAFAPRDEVFR